jgi:aryl-alcohol dehydrogenase-like predicted oxidoreductase
LSFRSGISAENRYEVNPVAARRAPRYVRKQQQENSSVEHRKLGASGLSVSLVGLGTNNFGGRIDLEASRKVIHAALDHGVTHFDTADIYGNSGGSETVIGKVLGARRDEVVLATKFGKPMAGIDEAHRGSRRYVASAVEASLTRLQTDRIDLLVMHEPDPSTPLDETFRALEDLRKAGKVRHFAASNFSAAEIGAATEAAQKLRLEGFVAAQDEYSLTHRLHEKNLFVALKTHGLSLVPYFPLGGGALTGKYRKDAPLPAGARHKSAETRFLEPHWDTIEALHAFAGKHGRTLLELAMSWLACNPLVASIIAGATRPEQVAANAKSVEWKLSAADMAEIDRIAAA